MAETSGYTNTSKTGRKNQYSYLKKRRESLKEERRRWVPHWRELQEYIDPLRGRFDDETSYQKNRPNFQKIITGRSIKARKTLSSGMQSGLTSPSRAWFKLSVADPDSVTQAVKEWLDIVHERMMKVMGSSNFYQEIEATYDELATFGTAAMIIEEDFDNVIRCKTFTAGTYFAATDASGMINTFLHDRWMTVQQIVGEFGYDKCPDSIKRKWRDDDMDERIMVTNLIETDYGNEEGRIKSCWYTADNDGHLLREGFFRKFPVMFPRWHTVFGSDYGYGPGTIALSDIKQLMRMQKDKLIGVAKQVSPPLLVSNSLMGQGIYTAPNAITYSSTEGGDADKQVSPLYPVSLNLSDLRASIADTEAAINESFYVDMFLMLQSRDNPQMTATEVAERRTEKMTVLSPVLERLEEELLTPAIVRIFDIMMDAGVIPEPPEDIQTMGTGLKLDYVSIMAQAQQAAGLQPLQQMSGYVATLLQSFPEISDKLDFDKIVEHYHMYIGTPADIIREQEEVDAIRQQRQQQLQQQQGMEQMVQGAGALERVASGAELMSNAGQFGDRAMSNMTDNLMGGSSLGSEAI